MKTRIIAGGIAAALLLGLLYWGSYLMMLLVVLACAGMAYVEYDTLFFSDPGLVRRTRVVLLIGFTIVMMHLNPSAVWIYLWIFFVIYCMSYVVTTQMNGDPVEGVRQLTAELLGYVYVVSLFGFIVPIVEHGPYGRHYLFLLFALVFMGDTVAYFAGRFFGKRPLASVISPKKTWEGSIGAVLGTTAMAGIWLVAFCPRELTTEFVVKVLAFAPLASVLGQFGDLFESLLKRSQAKKDSGSFLPGHGGILDRVDGLALAAPVFYFFLVYVLEAA
jgi:phosphatidate cytidylyltransferase